MNIDDIFPNGLDFNEARDLFEPLAIYILGMAIYSIFVFKFYRYIATQDIFEFDLSRYGKSTFRLLRVCMHIVLYGVKYIGIFPIVVFFWFSIITVMLTFLARDQTFPDILLVSMAMVGAIRVSAYIMEDLSRDIAKILPFAVLGIFVINVSFFEISESLDVLKQTGDHREIIFYGLVFLMALEFILRMGRMAFNFFAPSKKSCSNDSVNALI
jgi:hypothetical protein